MGIHPGEKREKHSSARARMDSSKKPRHMQNKMRQKPRAREALGGQRESLGKLAAANLLG